MSELNKVIAYFEIWISNKKMLVNWVHMLFSLRLNHHQENVYWELSEGGYRLLLLFFCFLLLLGFGGGACIYLNNRHHHLLQVVQMLKVLLQSQLPFKVIFTLLSVSAPLMLSNTKHLWQSNGLVDTGWLNNAWQGLQECMLICWCAAWQCLIRSSKQ